MDLSICFSLQCTKQTGFNLCHGQKYAAKEAEIDKEVRTERLFAVDSIGKLKVEGKKPDPVADTSTEILLRYALQRRGLRMDQADLLEFRTRQLWVDRVLKVRLQAPPAGYTRTSFRQVLEADKKLSEEACRRHKARRSGHSHR